MTSSSIKAAPTHIRRVGLSLIAVLAFLLAACRNGSASPTLVPWTAVPTINPSGASVTPSENTSGHTQEMTVTSEKRVALDIVLTPQSEVFVDGRWMGITPLHIELAPATYKLVLSAAGYISQEHPLTLATTTELSLTLYPQPLQKWVATQGCEILSLSPDEEFVVVYCGGHGPEGSLPAGTWLRRIWNDGVDWILLYEEDPLAWPHLVWSPNGEILLLGYFRGPTFLFHRGEWEIPLLILERTMVDYPVWSPDSKHVIIGGMSPDDELVVFSASGEREMALNLSEERLLPKHPLPELVQWMPNSQQFLYLSDTITKQEFLEQDWLNRKEKITLVDLETLHRELIFETPSRTFIDMDPSLSPDGNRLVFSTRQILDEESAVFQWWQSDIRTHQCHLWIEPYLPLKKGAWSPDSRFIIFEKSSPTDKVFLSIYDADLAIEIQEVFLAKREDGESGVSFQVKRLVWSPDGKYVAFWTNQGMGILTIDGNKVRWLRKGDPGGPIRGWSLDDHLWWHCLVEYDGFEEFQEAIELVPIK